jgi:hypothetical protein
VDLDNLSVDQAFPKPATFDLSQNGMGKFVTIRMLGLIVKTQIVLQVLHIHP